MKIGAVTDLSAYLERLLALPNTFVVAMSVKDTIGVHFSSEERAALTRVLGGADSVSQLNHHRSFAAVGRVGGDMATQVGRSAEDSVAIEWRGDGVTFSLKSSSLPAGNCSEIVIDGCDYSTKWRGLNIVLWDSVSGTVVDSVGFDRHPLNTRVRRLTDVRDEVVAQSSDLNCVGWSLPQALLERGIESVRIFVDGGDFERFRSVLWSVAIDGRIKTQFVSRKAFTYQFPKNYYFGPIHVKAVGSVGPEKSWPTGLLLSPSSPRDMLESTLPRGACVLSLSDLIEWGVYDAFCVRPLEELARRHPDCFVGVAKMPSIWSVPADERSEWERTIIDRRIVIERVREAVASGQMPGGFDGLGLSFEQVKELVTTPRSHIAENGTKVLDDLTSWGVNIADGHRVVPGSDRGSRTIHMLGDCEMFGTNARDDACIPGWLQRIASERDGWSNIRVTNHGHFVAWNMYNLPRIFNAVDVRPGDIIIANITYGYPKFDQIRLPGLDLSKNLDDRRKYGDIFVDNGHFNEQGYHYFADRIAAWLDAEGVIDVRGAETAGVEHRAKSSAKPLNLRRSTWEYVRDVAGSGVEAASGSIGPDRVNLPDGEQEGLRQYLASLAAIKPAIGAIVMNCNPFTLGHRFLVEESSSKVDKLYIFVVEEDKSFFPFADRLELVKSGTEDLGNVVVVPSGRYIISSLTFDDYFDKGTIQGQAIDPSNDVKIFARYIAPSLGINVRFAGEEPLDAITQQYNDTMARILPQWGIKFDVIARRENDGQVISASRVRSLLEQQNFEAIGQIVPRTTLEYLRARWKK